MKEGFIQCPRCKKEVNIVKVKENMYSCYLCDAIIKKDAASMKIINAYLKENFTSFGTPKKKKVPGAAVPGVKIAESTPKTTPKTKNTSEKQGNSNIASKSVGGNKTYENDESRTEDNKADAFASKEMNLPTDVEEAQPVDDTPFVGVVNGKNVDLITGEIIEDKPQFDDSLYDDDDYSQEDYGTESVEDIDIFGEHQNSPAEDIEEPEFVFGEYTPSIDEPDYDDEDVQVKASAEDMNSHEEEEIGDNSQEEVPAQKATPSESKTPEVHEETIEERLARVEAENAMLRAAHNKRMQVAQAQKQPVVKPEQNDDDFDILDNVNSVARRERVVKQPVKKVEMPKEEQESEELSEIDEDLSILVADEVEEPFNDDIEDELLSTEKESKKKVSLFSKKAKEKNVEIISPHMAEASNSNKRVNFAKKVDVNDDVGRKVSKKVFNSNVDGYYNDTDTGIPNESDIVPKSTIAKFAGIVAALAFLTFYCINVL